MASGWYIRTTADLLLAIPDHFVEDVRSGREYAEKLIKEEGAEGSGKPIISNTDLKSAAGQKIFFDVESEIFGEPVTGETDSAGYELKSTLNQFAVSIEDYLFAESGTRKSTERAFLKWIKKSSGRCGRAMARYRDHAAIKSLMSPAAYTTSQGVTITPTATTFYGGSASSVATLDSTCRLDTTEISRARILLEMQGALPIRSKTKDGQEVEFFEAYIDQASRYWLKTDAIWQQAVRDGLPRGWDGPLFSGALGYWDGILVKVWDGIIQGCHQGSPFRPECVLASNVTIGNSTITVGADDKRTYTEHFPTSGTLLITTPGGTDEELAYDNSSLTTAQKRYMFALTGTAAANHTAGNFVVLQNSASTCLFYGAEILCRAWGHDDRPYGDVWDGGRQMKVGVEATFGTGVIIDVDGKLPNYVLGKFFADRAVNV